MHGRLGGLGLGEEDGGRDVAGVRIARRRALAAPGPEGNFRSEPAESAVTMARSAVAAFGLALFLMFAATASASPPAITYSIDVPFEEEDESPFVGLLQVEAA